MQERVGHLVTDPHSASLHQPTVLRLVQHPFLSRAERASEETMHGLKLHAMREFRKDYHQPRRLRTAYAMNAYIAP